MIVTKSEIDKLVIAIKEEKIVIFPTETVYGIGANALSETAVKKIFEAKGRAADNPLIAHISDIGMLGMLTDNINKIEKQIMDRFWPGPLTIILKKKDGVLDILTAGQDTVAVRMPSNKIANELIRKCKVPIAAPSANISGRPSGTNVADIKEELESRVEYILDDGPCEVGIESTVIRVIDEEVIILRPGVITKEDLEQVTKKVRYDKHIFEKIDEDEKVLSPGMKYKHYAPKTGCILVQNINNRDSSKVINEYIQKNKEKKIVILSCSENIHKYNYHNVIKIIDMGESKNLKLISKNIFTDLRDADKLNCDVILIEGAKKEGIGIAIINRVIRACGYKVI